MCQLYIYVGLLGQPTIIASNRDEYFERSTSRGIFDSSTKIYSPKDLLHGGSWLALDCMSMKFCIILNFHTWRYSSDGLTTMKTLKSRGLLPTSFVKGSQTAKEFVDQLRESSEGYRGFNIIVGDQHAAYFYSNSVHGREPTLLRPGRLYGVSNGDLDDSNWTKIHRGKQAMNNILHHFLENCPLNPADGSVRFLLQTILTNVLLDATRLPDPTFGISSPQMCRLASIFVEPTMVEEDLIRRCLRLHLTHQQLPGSDLTSVQSTGCARPLRRQVAPLDSVGGIDDCHGAEALLKQGMETSFDTTGCCDVAIDSEEKMIKEECNDGHDSSPKNGQITHESVLAPHEWIEDSIHSCDYAATPFLFGTRTCTVIALCKLADKVPG